MNSGTKAAVKGLGICRKLWQSEELILTAPWEKWDSCWLVCSGWKEQWTCPL